MHDFFSCFVFNPNEMSLQYYHVFHSLYILFQKRFPFSFSFSFFFNFLYEKSHEKFFVLTISLSLLSVLVLSFFVIIKWCYTFCVIYKILFWIWNNVDCSIKGFLGRIIYEDMHEETRLTQDSDMQYTSPL